MALIVPHGTTVVRSQGQSVPCSGGVHGAKSLVNAAGKEAIHCRKRLNFRKFEGALEIQILARLPMETNSCPRLACLPLNPMLKQNLLHLNKRTSGQCLLVDMCDWRAQAMGISGGLGVNGKRLQGGLGRTRGLEPWCCTGTGTTAMAFLCNSV